MLLTISAELLYLSKKEIGMLVRITNACRMNCSHCMINAVPNGEHMSMETFDDTLEFIKDVGIPIIMLSGGEPLEHPQFFEIAEKVKRAGLHGAILSNGMFLSDTSLRERVLALGMTVQVTNDPRYYPEGIEEFDHPLLAYEHQLRVLTPLGRAVGGGFEFNRLSPMCYNLRSATRGLRSFKEALMLLRSKVKMCTPSINVDGTISAGESVQCYRIGSVRSKAGELAAGIMNMKSCNVCGLESNLSAEHKRAIGLD